MSGWAPFDCAGWPDVVEMLEGRSWPKAAAIYDLRWHVDQRRPLPGRTVLCKRWGWTDRKVRALLENTGEWWDATKGEAPSSRSDLEARTPVARRRVLNASQLCPGDVPVASHPSPEDDASTVPDVPNVSQSCPSDVLNVSTRAERSPSPTPSPSPGEEQQDAAPPLAPRPPPTDTSYDEAAAYLGQVVNLAVGKRPSAGPDRSSKPGQALQKAVRRDKALVLDAMRYVAEGEGEHAEFLRGRGTGLETILRHLDEYAERWRNPARPQHRARGSPDRSSPGDGFFAEMLDERTGRLNPRGDVIDAD